MYQYKTMEELHRVPGKQFVVGSVGKQFDDFEAVPLGEVWSREVSLSEGTFPPFNLSEGLGF